MTPSQTSPSPKRSNAAGAPRRAPSGARRQSGQGRASEGFVLLAMTLVAVAVGMGLYFQIGLNLTIASVCAVSVYVALISVHVLVRRRAAVRLMRGEIDRLNREVHHLRSGQDVQEGFSPATATDLLVTEGAATAQFPAPDLTPELQAPPELPVVRAAPDSGFGEVAVDEAARDHVPAPDQGLPAPDQGLPEATFVAPTLAAPKNEPVAEANRDLVEDLAQELAKGLSEVLDGEGKPPESPLSDDGLFAVDPPRDADTAVGEHDLGDGTAAVGQSLSNEPAGPTLTSDFEPGTESYADTATVIASGSGPSRGGAKAVEAPAASAAAQEADSQTAAHAGAKEKSLPLENEDRVAPPRDEDVEMIQGLIRKLAEEVNAVEAQAQSNVPVAPGPEVADQAIETSVGALRTAVGSMRVFEESRDGGAGGSSNVAPSAQQLHSPAALEGFQSDASHSDSRTDAVGTPPPVGPNHSRLSAIAEAITSGRIDIMLEPILGLEDKRTRHFDVSVRLRSLDGSVLEAPHEAPEIAGTGLLPLLDAGCLNRTAELARHLDERGTSGSVFSEFNSESLSAGLFRDSFDRVHQAREGISRQLVMTFSQADVRAFGTPEWETLAEIMQLGFRFAMADITDLDIDFDVLKSKGFDFVRLDAGVFLRGLPAGEGLIPSGDVCKYLAGVGMTLIVGSIEDGDELAQIFGFGVLFGQGRLFGGARPIKQEALGLPTTHVAA